MITMVVALIEILALTLFGNKTNNSLHAPGNKLLSLESRAIHRTDRP